MPTIYSDNNETPIIYTDYNNKVIENKKIEEIIKKEINFKKLKKAKSSEQYFSNYMSEYYRILKKNKINIPNSLVLYIHEDEFHPPKYWRYDTGFDLLLYGIFFMIYFTVGFFFMIYFTFITEFTLIFLISIILISIILSFVSINILIRFSNLLFNKK